MKVQVKLKLLWWIQASPNLLQSVTRTKQVLESLYQFEHIYFCCITFVMTHR